MQQAQNVYASLGFSVAIKFCFLNFDQQGGTETRFENPSRHKHSRWWQLLPDNVDHERKNQRDIRTTNWFGVDKNNSSFKYGVPKIWTTTD